MKTNFFKKYSYNLILASIAIVYFVFVLSLANKKSLWYDDIYQLFFSWNNSLSETLDLVLNIDLNPPLWAIFTHFWTQIAPYGTIWLKLPSIIFVALAIILSGQAAKELFGKRVGIVTASLLALSPFITLECAYSFRAYGFLTFSASFLIYMYIKKLKKPTALNRILFTIAIFFIAYTHYFGALLCVFLGISDLILAIKKKQPITFFLEYVIVASTELFWFIPQVSTITGALSSFWTKPPSIGTFFGVFKHMLLDSFLFSALFVFILIFSIIMLTKKIKSEGKKIIFEAENYCNILFLAIPIIFVFIIFVYSNIKTESSLFVYRYFAVLNPIILIYAASTLVRFFDYFAAKSSKHRIIATSMAAIILFAWLVPQYTIKIIYKTADEEESFEDAADMIMSEVNSSTSKEKIAVINTTNCGRGWEYYLSHNNTRDTSNIIRMDITDFEETEDLTKFETIYLFVAHFDPKIESSFSPVNIRNKLKQEHNETLFSLKNDEWIQVTQIPENSVYSYICKYTLKSSGIS